MVHVCKHVSHHASKQAIEQVSKREQEQSSQRAKHAIQSSTPACMSVCLSVRLYVILYVGRQAGWQAGSRPITALHNSQSLAGTASNFFKEVNDRTKLLPRHRSVHATSKAETAPDQEGQAPTGRNPGERGFVARVAGLGEQNQVRTGLSRAFRFRGPRVLAPFA